MSKINPTHVDIPFEPLSKKGHAVSPAQVEINVDGPQKVEAKVKLTDNKPVVYFCTTTPGTYTVSLKFHGEHLKLSPFSVEVKPKESKAEPDTPVPSLPHIPKNQIEFQVDALDEEGNPIPHSARFDIDVTGPDSVQPDTERDGEKIIISFFTYVSEGSFAVAVKYKGEHIQRSPFSVEIAPKSDPTIERREYEIEKKKGGIVSLELTPREIQFSVPGRLRDGSYTKANECSGVVVLGEDQQVSVNIADDHSQPDSFQISFGALKPGKHKISVLHKQRGEIAGSPFSINIPPEAFARKPN